MDEISKEGKISKLLASSFLTSFTLRQQKSYAISNSTESIINVLSEVQRQFYKTINTTRRLCYCLLRKTPIPIGD